MPVFKYLLNNAYQSALQSGAPITSSVAQQQALGQVIEEGVTIEQANRLRVSPTSKQVQTQINRVTAQSGGKKPLLANLKSRGLSMSDLDFLIRQGVAGANLQKKLFPIRKSGPIAAARQILIGAKKPISAAEATLTRTVTPSVDKCSRKILSYAQARARAKAYVRQLVRGAAFGKLAKKCSDDAASAASGGSIVGPVTSKPKQLFPYAEGFAPNIEAAVFRGPVHRFQLLGSIDGWHIVQVTGRRQARYSTRVIPSFRASLPVLIQEAHFQAWLIAKAESAYAKTKVFARVA